MPEGSKIWTALTRIKADSLSRARIQTVGNDGWLADVDV